MHEDNALSAMSDVSQSAAFVVIVAHIYPPVTGRIFPICSTFQRIRLFNPRSLQRHNRKTAQV